MWEHMRRVVDNQESYRPTVQACRAISCSTKHIHEEVLLWGLAVASQCSGGRLPGHVILSPIVALAIARVGILGAHFEDRFIPDVADATHVYAIVGDSVATEGDVRHYCALYIFRAAKKAWVYDSIAPGCCVDAVYGICKVIVQQWQDVDVIEVREGKMQLQRDANCGAHALLAVACKLWNISPVHITAGHAADLRRNMAVALAKQRDDECNAVVSGWLVILLQELVLGDAAEVNEDEQQVLITVKADGEEVGAAQSMDDEYVERFLAAILDADSDGCESACSNTTNDRGKRQTPELYQQTDIGSSVVEESTGEVGAWEKSGAESARNEVTRPVESGKSVANVEGVIKGARKKQDGGRRRTDNEKAVFMFDLPQQAKKQEITDVVYCFGNVVKVDMKRHSCAVVEFDHRLGAERMLQYSARQALLVRGKMVGCRQSSSRPVKTETKQSQQVGVKTKKDRSESSGSESEHASTASGGSVDGVTEIEWAQEWRDNEAQIITGDGYVEAMRRLLRHSKKLRRLDKLDQQGQFVGTRMTEKPVEAVRVAQLNGQGGCSVMDAKEYGNICGRYMNEWKVQFASLSEAGFIARDACKKRFLSGLQECGFTAHVWGSSSTPAGKGVALIWQAHRAIGKVEQDAAGRALSVRINLQSDARTPLSVRFISVYCPTGGTIAFVARQDKFRAAEEKLAAVVESWIEDAQRKEEAVIAMGDFNAIDDRSLDAIGTAASPRDESVLRRVLSMGLVDVFRMLHPDICASTRDTADGGNRLDYILVSPTLKFMPCGAAVHLNAGVASDHKPVLVDMVGVQTTQPPTARRTKQLNWMKFLRLGAEARKRGEDGLQEFCQEVAAASPISCSALGEISRKAQALADAGVRSVQVREEIGELVVKAQQAVNETVRRMCGNVTPGRKPADTPLSALWFRVIHAVRLTKTAADRLAVVGWTEEVVAELKKRDVQLRTAYEIACAAQSNADGEESVYQEIPGIPDSWARWTSVMESYIERISAGDCSIRKQAFSIRARTVCRGVKAAYAVRRELLHRGQIHQFLRRMDPKVKCSTGYKPEFLHAADGKVQEPRTTEEWLRAADQEHEHLLAAENKWRQPRYIRSWHDDVGNLRGELVHNVACNEKERQYRDAFYQPKAHEIDFAMVSGPLRAEEQATMFNRMATRQPGLSKFKMAAVQYCQSEMQQAIADIISVQLCLALVPTDNKRIVVVHIEKPTGGTRPLSLFEEMTKTVEGILSARLDAVSRSAGIGGILSRSNHAYQLGRGTAQPLTVDRVAREDARAHRKPIVRIQGDLDKWFDVLNRVVADADMGAKGYPERLRQLLAELYTNQICHIVTPWGLTRGVQKGEMGVGQGAISSPRISLHAQDAATRVIDKHLEEHGYVMANGCRLFQANYSDDWLWFASDRKGAQTMLRVAAEAWREYGISNKESKLNALYSAGRQHKWRIGDNVMFVEDERGYVGYICEINGDEVTVNADERRVRVQKDGLSHSPLTVDLWSWQTGETMPVRVNMHHMADKYKQLGVSATWKHGTKPYGKGVQMRTWLAIAHMLSKSPQYDEIACYVKTIIVSGMIYCPLASHIPPKQWHQMDIRVANGVRRSLGVARSTCRQSLYCGRKIGGLELPSLVAERLASCARELQVELMGSQRELATMAARDRWVQVRDLTPRQLRSAKSRYIDVVDYLAGYGIYMRDAEEKELSRVLDILARQDKAPKHSVTEGFSNKLFKHWRIYSSLGQLAAWMRQHWPQYKASSVHPRRFWEDAGEGTDYDYEKVAAACKTAIEETNADIKWECAMSNRPAVKLGDQFVAENMNAVTGECPVVQYLDDIASSHQIPYAWIGTDGAGHDMEGNPMVGAGVVFKRMVEDDEQRWAQLGDTIEALPIRMSRHYGAKVQTVRDAELRAVLVGLAYAADSVCPLVMDAQTEWKKVMGICEWSARRCCQGTNIPLENRLRRLMNKAVATEARPKWHEEVRKWWSDEVKTGKCPVSGRAAIWVHSHQTEEPKPNPFVVGVNEAADRIAADAVARGCLPDVRLPAGLPRFYFIIDGVAVVENIGKYIRTWATNKAQELWSQRARQGAVARVIDDIYLGNLPVRQYATVELPDQLQQFWHQRHEGAVRMESHVWKLRHYVSGSYTQMLHCDPNLQERIKRSEKVRVQSVFSQAVEPLCIRNCRLCIDPKVAEHGTLRHVAHSCSAPELTHLREAMWDHVEKQLRDIKATPNEACSHTNVRCACVAAWEKYTWCRRPGIWRVGLQYIQRWPVLAFLGWMVPVSSESRCIMDPMTETAYDMGYRAVLPKKIARQMFPSGSELKGAEVGVAIQENVHQITTIIAVMMGALRRTCVEMVRAKFPMDPQVADVAVSQQPIRHDVGGCQGSGCRRREREHGIPPNRVVVVAMHRCRQCRIEEMRSGTKADMEVMLKAKERYAAFVVNAQSIEDIRREFLRFKGGAQASMVNICWSLKMCGVRHYNDAGLVCMAVSWARINETCRCEQQRDNQDCPIICDRCALRSASHRPKITVPICQVCSTAGGVKCWGCGQYYHWQCVGEAHRGRTGVAWLCAVCYQKFSKCHMQICSSGEWLLERSKTHKEIQRKLAAEARSYGDIGIGVVQPDVEELQRVRGLEPVDDADEQ